MNEIDYAREVTLAEVLDRVLEKGVVIQGDLVISIADIDLVYIGLRAVISTVDKLSELNAKSQD